MSASSTTTPSETPQATAPQVPHNPALSKVASGDRAERVCPVLADVGEQEPGPASATCNPQPVTCNQPRPHCRAITTNGHRCRNYSLDGLHLCYSHFHHRHPALADKDHISVPLLEDHASIQLVMTQIVHGLLSMKLEPARARTAIWAAQVAAYTLPRPARLKGNEPVGEPVHRIGADHDGLVSADPDPIADDATGHRPQATGSPTSPPDLSYLCQVSATAEETWALQDRDDLGVNQPPPEQRYIDPWHAAPPPQPFPGWNVPPAAPSSSAASPRIRTPLRLPQMRRRRSLPPEVSRPLLRPQPQKIQELPRRP